MSGSELLVSLKKAAGAPGPQLLLPVGRPAEVFLRPVATRPERISSADVKCLTEWRNRHVQAFLTEFEATNQRTTNWLTEVVGPSPDKIVFMADHADGTTFGYMGLAFIDWKRSYGEADSIVRGGDAKPGTMTTALKTLISWGQGQLGLRQIAVRVRSDNSALDFYRKLGFKETKRVSLRRVSESETNCWHEDETAVESTTALVYMDYANRASDCPGDLSSQR